MTHKQCKPSSPFNILQMWGDFCSCRTNLLLPASDEFFFSFPFVSGTFHVSGSRWSATNGVSEIAVTQLQERKAFRKPTNTALRSYLPGGSEMTGITERWLPESGPRGFQPLKKKKSFQKGDNTDERKIEKRSSCVQRSPRPYSVSERNPAESPNQNNKKKAEHFISFIPQGCGLSSGGGLSFTI